MAVNAVNIVPGANGLECVNINLFADSVRQNVFAFKEIHINVTKNCLINSWNCLSLSTHHALLEHEQNSF